MKALSHIQTLLSNMAEKKCYKRNCGTVCLCEPCHAREALSHMTEDGQELVVVDKKEKR